MTWLRVAAVASFVALVLGTVVFASGCGDDDNVKSGPGGCPAELAADSAEWTHTGNDPQCAELAGELNQGLDLSGDDDGCSGGFDVDRNACTATLESECDGIGLSIACDVDAAGAADCTAVVTSAELESGRCAFDLRLR